MLPMLSSLPFEILEQILIYAWHDIYYLRQTCRIINAVSLRIIWRQVTIVSTGILENPLFNYEMDRVGPMELISLYKDYIGVVTVELVEVEEEEDLEWWETMSEILNLIWKNATGVHRVNICLDDCFLREEPIACNWLRIITRPFQKSKPLVVVEYTGGGGSKDLDDTRATVHMILQMKNVKFSKFEVTVSNTALDVGFFQDVGKYITHVDVFYADPSIIFISFNDAMKHCTSLESLDLRLRAGGGREADNYEYILPDSVRSVKVQSDDRLIHTIHGAQVTSLDLTRNTGIGVRGVLPNLKVIEIGTIKGNDPEAAKYFNSLVKASKQLEEVIIEGMYPPAVAEIAGIMDHRFYVSSLLFDGISSIDAMAHIPAMTLRAGRGPSVVARIAPHEMGNTALLWRFFTLIFEKLPGLLNLSFMSKLPPLPDIYVKEDYAGSDWYYVDVDRVKQRLLESSPE
ncbi:hypothetical protein TRVA0_001S01068 [Trichomonascus vanleenenianus]|uniref:uncharacterized protein n=1 Tax=Trichomonascus vanleenenianus TaxID=2268995 RepID=UPI003EC98DBD